MAWPPALSDGGILCTGTKNDLLTCLEEDLVWDTYLADSLKGSTRAKRGQGVRRRVVAAAAIPGNWSNFLRVDDNKTELFRFLSAALMEWFDQEDKQLVNTDGEKCSASHYCQI